MTSLSSHEQASDISVPAYQRGFQTLKNETSVPALEVEGRKFSPRLLAARQPLVQWDRSGR